jgi:Bifunctional DNA primase/polymerase, N-terminal
MTPHQCFTILPAEAADLGLGTAALRYQRLGYAVLALGYGSKRPHPLFEHGVSWATTDERMVYWLWRQQRAAGIGIATGQRSNLLVIDLDIHHGNHGPSEFEGFMDAWSLPLPPNIPTVVTPSGGQHLWFRTPPGWPVPARKGILPGIDIQGDGNYVVAPPSRAYLDSSEGDRVLLPYRWMGDSCPCSPPMAPPWIFDWISRSPATGASVAGGDGLEGSPDVEQARAQGLQPGSRNVTLHRIACSLYRKYGTGPEGVEMTRRTIDEVLAKTPRTGGWGPPEIARALSSALRFVRSSEQAEERRHQETAPELQAWMRRQAT